MSVQFRILNPIKPGVFTGQHEKAQNQIIKACEALGIDSETVSAVGMLGDEILSIDIHVRHMLAPMDEPAPDDPDCDENMPEWTGGPLTISELTNLTESRDAARAELEACQTEFSIGFERWAEIQRYRTELVRIDAQKSPARQARRNP